MILDPEDEAFNEIERQAKQRKEAVLQALHSENERLGLYKDAYGQQEPVIDKSAAIRIATSLGWSPQRTWVGLTEDDIAQAMYKADAIFTGPMQFRFAEEIEAKLKEKNNG